MSRTADAPRWYNHSANRLIFCFLIGCLAIHFLVEDALLFSEAAFFDPGATNASQANYEEFEHLDDLVYAESIPGNVVDPVGCAAFVWIAPFVQPACFSIFKPPKIQVF